MIGDIHSCSCNEKAGFLMAKRKLSGVSTTDLQRELDRRRKDFERLQLKREQLAMELETIDDQLRDLSNLGFGDAAPTVERRGPGRPPKNEASAAATGRKKKKKTTKKKTGKRGRRGPRSNNEYTLQEALAQVLQGRTLSVKDLVEEVQKFGYKTNSNSFRTIVNQTLLRHPDTFKKVGRGEYTAK